tara:strand:- start:4507 stop:5076 length:570 start_codon:yes stop_codon:yes gene_type:complete
MPEDKNKHLSSNEDSNLFRQSMGDVKPLSHDKYNLLESKLKPKPVKKPVHQLPIADQNVFYEVNDIQSDEHLFFARQGIQHRLIRQLKRGDIRVDDKVDLHGLTQLEAQQLLDEFLAHQLEQRHRCILVVHGKGIGSLNNRPVLKNLVFNLLKNDPAVLALSSAQQRDGGTGALYVLLKKEHLSGVEIQ